jgi:HlyD family secretion protein
VKYKWLIAIGFVLVVSGLVWANLRNAGAAKTATATEGPKGAPLVKVVTVKPRDMTQTVLAPGTLEATGSREIRAPFSSLRVHVLVGMGDKVKAGQALAELEAGDLRVQVAGQEAAVARAESTAAQLNQQRETAPRQLSQKLEAAKAQLIQAQAGLESATRSPASAKQRLEQAQAGLLSVQNRAASAVDEAGPARLKLQSAEADFRANPTSNAARKAYDDARAAYEAALRRSADAAKQAVADLSQARQAVEVAQAEFDAVGADDAIGVRQARTTMESARIAVEIATRDAESGGVLIEQVRSAEADLSSARVTLENSRARLAQAALTAPNDGVVLALGLKDGQPAQQGQLLMELGGLDSLLVKARVDEVDIGKVQTGQPLSVKSNAYPQDKFSGAVTRVAAQSSVLTPGAASSYEVQGEVKNSGNKLRSGMNIQASVVTDTRTKVIVVGLESVREEGEKASVLVARDFKVEIREVKLGLRTQTQVQVVEGLKEGDKVIVSPFTFIRSAKKDDAIRVDPVEPAAQEEPS